MPGKGTKYEAMAREAADRIVRARERGQQLTFLGDERGAPPVDTIEREAGDRRVRGPGKQLNQMRDWLASRGYRLPEEVLAQLAALNTGDDPIVAAMARAEQVLAWACDGQVERPTMGQRMAMFAQVLTVQLRAAEAILPYGAPKASPDAPPTLAVQVITAPVAPSGAPMRDVTPGPTRLADRRMVPADVRAEIERNQGVAGDDRIHSDAGIRTEGTTR